MKLSEFYRTERIYLTVLHKFTYLSFSLSLYHYLQNMYHCCKEEELFCIHFHIGIRFKEWKGLLGHTVYPSTLHGAPYDAFVFYEWSGYKIG